MHCASAGHTQCWATRQSRCCSLLFVLNWFVIYNFNLLSDKMGRVLYRYSWYAVGDILIHAYCLVFGIQCADKQMILWCSYLFLLPGLTMMRYLIWCLFFRTQPSGIWNMLQKLQLRKSELKMFLYIFIKFFMYSNEGYKIICITLSSIYLFFWNVVNTDLY